MTAVEEGKRRGLGRGLSALLGEVAEEAEGGEAAPRNLRNVGIDRLRPGRYQPRQSFDDDAISDLVDSIREKGILQPILVRRLDDGDGFEIIAGERRWRAAQRAGLHEVPVLVKDFSDREALEVALVENLQRQDLSALEEAQGYRRLLEEFGNTQEELARAVGKSRSHVANTMRLLALPDPVKLMVEAGELTAGHARALLATDDPLAVARQVVARGLNVRQTEKLAQKPPRRQPKAPRDEHKDADTRALERDLSALLGLKVTIEFHGRGGELTIHYGTLEQLDDILHRLSHAPPPGAARAAADMDADLDPAAWPEIEEAEEAAD